MGAKGTTTQMDVNALVTAVTIVNATRATVEEEVATINREISELRNMCAGGQIAEDIKDGLLNVEAAAKIVAGYLDAGAKYIDNLSVKVEEILRSSTLGAGARAAAEEAAKNLKNC